MFMVHVWFEKWDYGWIRMGDILNNLMGSVYIYIYKFMNNPFPPFLFNTHASLGPLTGWCKKIRLWAYG